MERLYYVAYQLRSMVQAMPDWGWIVLGAGVLLCLVGLAVLFA